MLDGPSKTGARSGFGSARQDLSAAPTETDIVQLLAGQAVEFALTRPARARLGKSRQASRNRAQQRSPERLHGERSAFVLTPQPVGVVRQGVVAQPGVRALELTAAGRAALPHLSEGLACFQAGVDALRSARHRDVLTVSVAPSIGARWLVPRLERLRVAHPEFDIRIDARNELATFTNDGIDAAIRYGRGDYAPHHADCLFSASAFPVCSPALITNGTPLGCAADLANVTLLHSTWAEETVGAPSWRMWLNAAGASEIDASTGPRFGSDSMLVEAALAGQGVALVSEAPVARELADGRLVRPFPPAVFEQTAFCYWFVYPERHRETPKVLGFKDWLLGEIARDAAFGNGHDD